MKAVPPDRLDGRSRIGPRSHLLRQRNIKTNFQQVVSLSPLLSDDLQTLAMNITEPGRVADFIARRCPPFSTIDEVLALALQPVSSDVRPHKKEPKEPKQSSPVAARH